MSRLPHRQPLPRAWFMRRASERRYMLREASSLWVAAYALHLLWGIGRLARSPEAFASWLAWQTHPLAVAATAACVAFMLLHAATWFVITPKVLPQVVAGRRVPAMPLVVGAWVVTVGVTGALAWWVGAPNG